MPSNDREVFDHLASQAEVGKQERQIAFLSYALFAYEKREWIKLFKSKNADEESSQADIDGWISNITGSLYTTWRNEAERFFVDAADAYFEDRFLGEREAILRSAIVSEVKAAGSFGRQLGIALATAILAPLIIGGVIALAIVYDKQMVTGTWVADRVGNATKAPVPPTPASPTPLPPPASKP